MRRKNKSEVVPISRIIHDPSDASKDTFMPTPEADDLYTCGKLAIDLTNTPDTDGRRVYTTAGGQLFMPPSYNNRR